MNFRQPMIRRKVFKFFFYFNTMCVIEWIMGIKYFHFRVVYPFICMNWLQFIRQYINVEFFSYNYDIFRSLICWDQHIFFMNITKCLFNRRSKRHFILGIISGLETKKFVLLCTSCEILRSHGCKTLASTPSLKPPIHTQYYCQ